MLKPVNLFIAGNSYTPRSEAVAAQQCVNLFTEVIEDAEEGQKGKIVCYGRPGRHLAKQLTTIDAAATPIRGLWSGNGRLFVAAGTKYMELDSSYALVGSVRTINDDATHTPVQFIPNSNNQLLIVSAGVVYCDSGSGPLTITFPTATGTVNTSGLSVFWVSGDLFTPGMVGLSITINAVAYVVASYVSPTQILLTSTAGVQAGVAFSTSEQMNGVTGTYLNGYFIVNRTVVNSRQFNWSNLNDGNVWDALDYAQKESNPDSLRSVMVHDAQLYLWGYSTFEVWQVTGQGIGGSPFERINGAGGNYGSISAWGPIAIEGRVYFIGGSAEGGICAYVLNGFTPERVSTFGEETRWNSASLGLNCISYSYREEGHTFWCINFGTQTWCMDVASLAWSERKYWDGAAEQGLDTTCHTYIPEFASGAGVHLVGGKVTSNLYISSVNYYDDNGVDIYWTRDTPSQYAEGNMIYFGRQTLEMQTGTVPSGAEPVITRYQSDDRGKTFTNAQTAGLGVHDDFTKRVFWPAGGASRNRIWRYKGNGQYKVALVNLISEQEAGAS